MVGDVTKPETLTPAVEYRSGMYSVLAAGPGRGDPETMEFAGNLNLLQVARSAGIGRFVYSSALMADMFALFDSVGHAADPAPLRDLFGVEALTIEEWAGRVSRSRPFG